MNRALEIMGFHMQGYNMVGRLQANMFCMFTSANTTNKALNAAGELIVRFLWGEKP